MTLSLWVNKNQRIGISEYNNVFIVTPSVFDGNKHQIIGSKKFKTLVKAEQHVNKLIGIAKKVGMTGEYKKIK